MRVAAFSDRIGPYHLARFSALGASVHLSVFEYIERDDHYKWEKQPEAEQFERVCLNPGAGLESCGFWRISRLVRKALRERRFDAALVPGWGTARALATLLECNIAGVPAVLMSESTELDRHRKHVVERLKRTVIRRYSSALVGGEAHAKYLIQLGMSPQDICVGYDVVDNAHFATPLGEMPGLLGKLSGGYFFCCARFIAEKNLPRLLEAYRLYLEQIGECAHFLVLAGAGPMEASLIDLVRSLGIGERVVFAGFVGYRELPAFYQHAEWFVLPSTSEPWGLVVNEALASGLPVIVSNRCGCVCELVKEGRTGWSFDPHSVEAIAGALIRAHYATTTRALMRENALAMMKSFGPDLFAQGASMAIGIARRKGSVGGGNFAKRVGSRASRH